MSWRRKWTSGQQGGAAAVAETVAQGLLRRQLGGDRSATSWLPRRAQTGLPCASARTTGAGRRDRGRGRWRAPRRGARRVARRHAGGGRAAVAPSSSAVPGAVASGSGVEQRERRDAGVRGRRSAWPTAPSSSTASSSRRPSLARPSKRTGKAASRASRRRAQPLALGGGEDADQQGRPRRRSRSLRAARSLQLVDGERG